MPGGFIFLKENLTQASSQNGTDKSLLIDPNYAYQVPFTFLGDWSDIKVGVYISFVQTGVGNEDIGCFPLGQGSSVNKTIDSGGITPDTFFYFGLTKEGNTNALPTTANNSGFIGVQSDLLRMSSNSKSVSSINRVNTERANKITNSEFDSLETLGPEQIGNGVNKIISTSGASILDTGQFNASQGNFNVVGHTGNVHDVATAGRNEEFCDYWGVRFQVINKGESNQKIKITASVGHVDGLNHPMNNNAISDPSSASLVNLLNGIGETSFPSPSGQGGAAHFEWNKDGAPMAIPDSLFIYNGFPNARPRIHAWAAKRSS